MTPTVCTNQLWIQSFEFLLISNLWCPTFKPRLHANQGRQGWITLKLRRWLATAALEGSRLPRCWFHSSKTTKVYKPNLLSTTAPKQPWNHHLMFQNMIPNRHMSPMSPYVSPFHFWVSNRHADAWEGAVTTCGNCNCPFQRLSLRTSKHIMRKLRKPPQTSKPLSTSTKIPKYDPSHAVKISQTTLFWNSFSEVTCK